MKFEAAFFDLNGTLLDDGWVGEKCMRGVFEVFNVSPPPIEDWQMNAGENFLKFYHTRGIPKEKTAKELVELWNEITYRHREEVNLRPGTRSVLEFCAFNRIRVVLVSAEQMDIVHWWLSRFALHNFFEMACCSVRSKSHLLNLLIEEMGLDPQRCLMVGDTPHDIRAAHEAKIKSVFIEGGYGKLNGIAPRPCASIQLLEELVPFIQNSTPGIA